MSIAKKSLFIFLLFSLCLTAFSGCNSAPSATSGESGSGTPQKVYPEKNITMIIQSSPGGGSDLFARTFTNVVTNDKLLPVVVSPENMPGASGAVAYAYVAGKVGDPYTLLNASGTFITTPILGQGTDAEKINYTQFTPIAALCLDEMVIAVNADSEYQTLDDVIQDAKANPDAVLAGGTEFGSPDSICYYLLEKETGADFNFIVFDGGDEVNAALLGNNINVAIGNPGDFLELYKAGRFRLLGTFSDERLECLKDVPTVKEQGIDAIYQLTRGFAAPKDIPQEAVEVLEKLVIEYMKTDTWKDYVNANSLTEKYLTSSEFTTFLKESTEMHTEILREMGVIE